MSLGTKETIREALLRASRFFEEKGVRSPQFNAELLLQHVLCIDRTKMLVRFQEPFPQAERAAFDELLARRGAGVPLQHLTGEQEFYGRPFYVSEDVLIPRPETELLIERVLQEKSAFDAPVLVDIGTGSGAIALTLALEWPEAQVFAVDISPAALMIARRNAERLGVADRVRFWQGDLVQPIVAHGLRPQIVVSNPPYIPTADCEQLDVEVRDHEPRLALDGGSDGLDPYRVICGALPKLWPDAGPAFVAYEVGIHQDRAVEALIRAALPLAEPGETGIVPDWQGIGRVIWGRRGV